VIDVRVAQHEGIDVLRIERKRFGIAPFDFLVTLDHAAVEQDLVLADANEMRRARDFAVGSAELDLHGDSAQTNRPGS
jgi:hypothetical protein